jgi:hypothetical protein
MNPEEGFATHGKEVAMSSNVKNDAIVSPDKGKWPSTSEEIAGYALALAFDVVETVPVGNAPDRAKYEIANAVHDGMLVTCQTGVSHLPDLRAKAVRL